MSLFLIPIIVGGVLALAGIALPSKAERQARRPIQSGYAQAA